MEDLNQKRLIKRTYQRRFVASKKALGWKTLTLIIPPEVSASVLEYKNRLMNEYRNKVMIVN